VVKPKLKENAIRSFIEGSVACPLCHNGLVAGIDRSHHRHRQFHTSYRLL